MSTTHPPSGRRRPATDPITFLGLLPRGDRIFAASPAKGITIFDTTSRSVHRVIPVEGTIRRIVMDPLGKTITAMLDTGLACFSAESGEPIYKVLNYSLSEAQIAYTSDGIGRALTLSAKKLTLWDLATGARLRTLGEDHEDVSRAVLSNRADRVISIDAKNTLRFFDAESGECLGAWGRATFCDPMGRLLAVAFHPDGRRVLSSTFVDIVLWDAERGERRWQRSGPSSRVETSIFQPDGRLALMVGHSGKTIEIWDLDEGRVRSSAPAGSTEWASRRQEQNHHGFSPWGLPTNEPPAFRLPEQGNDGAESSIALCPDGRRILTLSEDRRAFHVVDAETGDTVTAKRLHASPIQWLLPHPNGVHLITASKDEPILVWDLESGAPLEMLGRSRDSGALGSGPVAVNASGSLALSAHADGAVNLWDLAQGTCVRVARADGPVDWIAFHAEDTRALVAAGGKVVVWPLEGSLVTSSSDTKLHLRAFAADERCIYALSEDDWLHVWDVGAGRYVETFYGEGFGERPVIHAGLRRAAFSCVDGGAEPRARVKVVNLDAADVIAELTFDNTPGSPITAFCPDGDHLVIAAHAQALLWSIPQKKALSTIDVPPGAVHSIAIDPAGRGAVLGLPGEVWVWDFSWSAVMERWQAGKEVCAVSVGGDGRIVVACSDGSVSLFRAGEMDAPRVEAMLDELSKALRWMIERYSSIKRAFASSEYSGSDWDDYSFAKGNLRWLVAYKAEVEAMVPAPARKLADVVAELESLVDEVPGDSDHEEPHRAREGVREWLSRYRSEGSSASPGTTSA